MRCCPFASRSESSGTMSGGWVPDCVSFNPGAEDDDLGSWRGGSRVHGSLGRNAKSGRVTLFSAGRYATFMTLQHQPLLTLSTFLGRGLALRRWEALEDVLDVDPCRRCGVRGRAPSLSLSLLGSPRTARLLVLADLLTCRRRETLVSETPLQHEQRVQPDLRPGDLSATAPRVCSVCAFYSQPDRLPPVLLLFLHSVVQSSPPLSALPRSGCQLLLLSLIHHVTSANKHKPLM